MKRIITMLVAVSAIAVTSFAAPLASAKCCCGENAAATCCCGDTCSCCKH